MFRVRLSCYLYENYISSLPLLLLDPCPQGINKNIMSEKANVVHTAPLSLVFGRYLDFKRKGKTGLSLGFVRFLEQ